MEGGIAQHANLAIVGSPFEVGLGTLHSVMSA